MAFRKRREIGEREGRLGKSKKNKEKIRD